MRCVFCNYHKTKVTDKRACANDNSIRRRRECLRCNKRFTTYERVEPITVKVIKKDGRKEAYDKNKLLQGIEKAFKKRPISKEKIRLIVSRVESKIRKKNEIKSEQIGKMVLKELKKIDDIAYLRFASVYKEFNDIKSFKKEFNELKRG